MSLGPEQSLEVWVGVVQPGLRQARGGGVVREERGRGEEFVPADDDVAEVEVIQQDLSHAHEDLLVHAAVVPPHRHLATAARGMGTRVKLRSQRRAHHTCDPTYLQE